MNLTLEELLELGVNHDTVNAQIEQLNGQVASYEASLHDKQNQLEQLTHEMNDISPTILVLQERLNRWQNIATQMSQSTQPASG